MADKKKGFLSRLNVFSNIFRKVENTSEESRVQSEVIENSQGYSETDMGQIKSAMKDYFDGNSDDFDGSVSSFNQAEQVVSSVNKASKVVRYREVERYPECSDALDYICDEAIFVDTSSRVLTISFKRNIPPQIERVIKAEFDYITYDVMELHKNAWHWFRRWLVDSEIFMEKILNTDRDRIVGVKQLAPQITYPIYAGDEILYYLQENKSKSSNTMGGAYTTYNNDSRFVRLNKDQVSYVNYGEFGTSFLDVRGFLDPALLPFNHLKNLEIALLLYRLVRAPERYIFNVEVGKMPVQKGREYIERLKSEHRKEEFFDANTGEVDIFSNFMTVLNDFWFMKRQGDGSSVETIGGNMDLGNINDVDHFLKKLYRAMKIPKSRWAMSEGEGQYPFGKPGEISYEEHKFSMMAQRLRSRYVEMVKDVFFTQLKLDGVPDEYISEDFLVFNFTDANLFQKQKELMNLESELAQVNSVTSMIISEANKEGLFSKEYMLRRIMGDAEYELNHEMCKTELDVIAQKEIDKKDQEEVGESTLDNFDSEPTDSNEEPMGDGIDDAEEPTGDAEEPTGDTEEPTDDTDVLGDIEDAEI